eukprot:3200333-Lingulodinium_polyedra.AAC.1
MAQLVQTASQFVAVQESVSVVRFKRLQFIARAKYIEGLDDSVAAAEWESDLDDIRVMKRGSGDDLDVAVSEPRRTQ